MTIALVGRSSYKSARLTGLGEPARRRAGNWRARSAFSVLSAFWLFGTCTRYLEVSSRALPLHDSAVTQAGKLGSGHTDKEATAEPLLVEPRRAATGWLRQVTATCVQKVQVPSTWLHRAGAEVSDSDSD
jgi:hypothetical protein